MEVRLQRTGHDEHTHQDEFSVPSASLSFGFSEVSRKIAPDTKSIASFEGEDKRDP